MKKIIMVSPKFFDVKYAINAYMTSPNGELNTIDYNKAQSQWENLYSIYTKVGFSVDVIEGIQGLPDMVFAANQSFPFWNSNLNRPEVILSNMHSEYRKKEVKCFEEYYSQREYTVHSLDSNLSFEGNGDALIRPNTKEIYGGYGFRTDQLVYQEIEKITGYKVFSLELKNKFFYHLDTCFAFLNQSTVAIVPEAFTKDGLDLLCQNFQNVIEIDLTEAKQNFAGNFHSVDGQKVIIQEGSNRFIKSLSQNGFEVIPVDTSEYMKSGGSVFCMKMECY